MPLFVSIDKSPHHVLLHVYLNGAWRSIPQVWVFVSGTWRPMWSYSWDLGAWSQCSVQCGGGTQTRTVTCTRTDDKHSFPDSVCEKLIGTKPPTSQPCNTQSCVSCQYTYGVNGTNVTGCWGGQPKCWMFRLNGTLMSNGIWCASDCTNANVTHCKHGAGCSANNGLQGTLSGTCGPWYRGPLRNGTASFCDWDDWHELCGPF